VIPQNITKARKRDFHGHINAIKVTRAIDQYQNETSTYTKTQIKTKTKTFAKLLDDLRACDRPITKSATKMTEVNSC